MTITITNETKLKIHEYAKMLLVGPPTIRKVAKSQEIWKHYLKQLHMGHYFIASWKLKK